MLPLSKENHMQTKPTPATDREIRNILGSSDDDVIQEIRATGATEKEVLQAFGWLEADDYMGKTQNQRLNDKSLKVYEILVEERDEQNPDRR
jgi:hypothetical protein